MSAGPDRPPILIAVDMYPDGGGISSIVENCAMTLTDRFDVHVAIVDTREDAYERLPLPRDRIHVLTSRHLLKPYLMPTSLLYSVRVGGFLRRLTRRIRPAVVLVQDGLFLPVPGLLATAGLPSRLVVMDHGTLTNSMDREWQRMFPTQLPRHKSIVVRAGFRLDQPWLELRWRLGLRHADQVWYVGEELKPWVQRAGSTGRQYKQTVPPDFLPAGESERAAARRAFDVPAGATLISMVNRLAVEKGLDEALDAIGAVLGKRDDAYFLIAGDGPLRDALQATIERSGMSGRVRLLGQLDRPSVRRLLHASDFFLYTGTISCGMSLGLLEAMAAGVIPIVSDVPREQRDLVGDAGWVYPATSVDELKRALAEAVLTGDAERARRRQEVQERLATYTSPSIGDLIEQILPEPDARPRAATSSG